MPAPRTILPADGPISEYLDKIPTLSSEYYTVKGKFSKFPEYSEFRLPDSTLFELIKKCAISRMEDKKSSTNGKLHHARWYRPENGSGFSSILAVRLSDNPIISQVIQPDRRAFELRLSPGDEASKPFFAQKGHPRYKASKDPGTELVSRTILFDPRIKRYALTAYTNFIDLQETPDSCTVGVDEVHGIEESLSGIWTRVNEETLTGGSSDNAGLSSIIEALKKSELEADEPPKIVKSSERGERIPKKTKLESKHRKIVKANEILGTTSLLSDSEFEAIPTLLDNEYSVMYGFSMRMPHALFRLKDELLSELIVHVTMERLRTYPVSCRIMYPKNHDEMSHSRKFSAVAMKLSRTPIIGDPSIGATSQYSLRLRSGTGDIFFSASTFPLYHERSGQSKSIVISTAGSDPVVSIVILDVVQKTITLTTSNDLNGFNAWLPAIPDKEERAEIRISLAGSWTMGGKGDVIGRSSTEESHSQDAPSDLVGLISRMPDDEFDRAWKSFLDDDATED